MTSKENSLNWFEIAVTDLARAKKFYETIFDITMPEMEMPGMRCAMFPSEPMSGKANGCLLIGPMHRPSADGVKLYLNGNPDLAVALSKVEAAGGKVTMPKTSIGPNGFMAFIIDTEGNHIGLHSNK